MLFAAIIISAFGGLIMFAARTGPAEATSNISKWLVWMGTPIPRWLSTPIVDHWATRVSIGLLVVAGILFCSWVYTNVQAPSGKPYGAPSIGENNTLLSVPVPPSMGSGNTIVGPNLPNRNVIYNQGGIAVGKNACADSNTVAIGSGASAGACKKKP
jgi:hypothetical protein